MRIIITIKNLEQSDALKKFIEKKFLGLKKYINILKQDNPPEGQKTLAEVFVEVEKETRHHKKGDIFRVKAKVCLPKRVIMADEKAEDVFFAVVAAKDELKMEIEKYKFKKIDKTRKKQRELKNIIKNL